MNAPCHFVRRLLWITAIAIAATHAEAGDANRPFSLRRDAGAWWLCAPDGRRFFSFGVCCVNQGTGRDEYSVTNPGYAAWQNYPSSQAWADAAVQRLRTWNFNTIGGWSDFAPLRGSTNRDFALAPVLACGMRAGAPWLDMWSPKVLQRMEEVARQNSESVRSDPRVLGYYTDNEMGWWNAILWQMTLKDKPASGARQRLVKLLRDRYRNDWSKLTRDFDPEGVSSFRELERGGTLYLRPGGNGIHAMREFLGMMAARYYEVVDDAVRKFDHRALVLGDRYQSFYYPEVARAAGRHVDAISSNLNASWNDGSFVRFYLDTLHALAGKPVLVSEFYMSAMENRTGNPNDHGNFPTVQTQAERADAFERTLRALTRLPYVLGADWFQYYDEPAKGRFDGENFNMGLVDVRDRPYEELTGRATSLDLLKLKSAPQQPRADVREGVPRAPNDPFANFKSQTALKHWDRERGFVPAASKFPMADLYVCWDASALYFGLYAVDPVEPEYYRDGRIPEEDRAEWTVSLGGKDKTIRVRLGAGRLPTGMPTGIMITNLSGLRLNVRNIAAMKVPASFLASKELRPGDRLKFSSTLLTHARASRVEWAEELRLVESAAGL